MTDFLLDRMIEIQAIAQTGLTYSKDPYDLERFERLREITVEIMAQKTGLPQNFVREVFCNETGFQTPKLDTRAAIFQDGKILMVLEKDSQTWSLPGGWVDVNQSVKNNTEKEVKEEAGLDVQAERLIAVLDRDKHNKPQFAYGVCKIFVQCKFIGGEFRPNTETVKSRFFAPEELPDNLSFGKNTVEQILLCFRASRSQYWETVFD